MQLLSTARLTKISSPFLITITSMTLSYTSICTNVFSTAIGKASKFGHENGLGLLIDLETFDSALNIDGTSGLIYGLLDPRQKSCL